MSFLIQHRCELQSFITAYIKLAMVSESVHAHLSLMYNIWQTAGKNKNKTGSAWLISSQCQRGKKSRKSDR